MNRPMQSLKDATVVLGLLLLLVSVKVTPLESVGDVIPAAEAAPAKRTARRPWPGSSSDPSVRRDASEATGCR